MTRTGLHSNHSSFTYEGYSRTPSEQVPKEDRGFLLVHVSFRFQPFETPIEKFMSLVLY